MVKVTKLTNLLSNILSTKVLSDAPYYFNHVDNILRVKYKNDALVNGCQMLDNVHYALHNMKHIHRAAILKGHHTWQHSSETSIEHHS